MKDNDNLILFRELFKVEENLLSVLFPQNDKAVEKQFSKSENKARKI